MKFYLLFIATFILCFFNCHEANAALKCSGWLAHSEYKNSQGDALITAEYKTCSSDSMSDWPIQISWRITNHIADRPIYDVGIGNKVYTFSNGTVRKGASEWCKNRLESEESCKTMADSGPAGTSVTEIDLVGCVNFRLEKTGKRFNACDYLTSAQQERKKEEAEKKKKEEEKLKKEKEEQEKRDKELRPTHKVLNAKELAKLRDETQLDSLQFKLAVGTLSSELRLYGYDIHIIREINGKTIYTRNVSAACYKNDSKIYHSWSYTKRHLVMPELPEEICNKTADPRSYNTTKIMVFKYEDPHTVSITRSYELWWVSSGPMKFLVRRSGVKSVVNALLQIHKAAHQPKPFEVEDPPKFRIILKRTNDKRKKR